MACMKITVVILFLVAAIEAHRYMRPSIKNLEDEVDKLKEENDRIYEALDFLESNLTSQIALQCGNGEPAAVGGRIIHNQGQAGNTELSHDTEERLRALEERIYAIKRYLSGEKKLDEALRIQSKEVINVMEGKVVETTQVIEDLRTNVAETLSGFQNRIEEVNTIANVIVSSEGTVMYGQIGSACTEYGQECVDLNSECRSYRCQCEPGMSYDINDRKCVEKCDMYGITYQVVNKKIIRSFNDLTLNETNLAECKKVCEEAKTFVCRSFDYFPQWKSCYLSKNVVTEVPDENWEYNSEGIHFQRDCAKRVFPGAN